jgi:hypothetical protein
MVAANQDQQRSAVRTALIFVQVLSPSAASRDDAAPFPSPSMVTSST